MPYPMLGFVASTTPRGINKTEFLFWRIEIIKYLLLSISCVCLRTLHARVHRILKMTIGRCYCFLMSPKEVVISPTSFSLPTFFIFLFQFFCYFLAAHVLANVKYCVCFFPSLISYFLAPPSLPCTQMNKVTRWAFQLWLDTWTGQWGIF